MPAEDDFLRAFSFHDVPSLSASPTPTLYTVKSEVDPYAATYGAVREDSRDTGGYGYGYGYGVWQQQPPRQQQQRMREAESRAKADAAVAATEKERRVLRMEVEMAEEQRRRLEACLTASRSRPMEREVGDVLQRECPPCTPGSAAASVENAEELTEAAVDAVEVARYASPTRELSVAVPPPCSPSPPFAHVRHVLRAEKRTTPAPSASPPRQEAQRSSKPRPEVEDAYVLAAAEVGPLGALRHRASPSPSPSRSPSPVRSAGRKIASPRRAAPSPSASPRHSQPPRQSSQRSVRTPSPQPLPLPEPHTSTPQPRVLFATSTDSHAPVPTDDAVSAAEEERLYAAYQRKLARIQQALQHPSVVSTVSTYASAEARLAHQQRQGVCTPRPPTASFRVLEDTSAMHDAPSGPLLPFAAPPGTDFSPPLRASLPLLRRAPSLGSTAGVAPLPDRPSPRRQLRWDSAHSGNVIISPDGFCCRADAADAIALIEAEYGEHLTEVLPRLVIPFYVVGSAGVTQGVLHFAFQWTAPTKAGRRPALAFGFAGRAFTGYGTEAPAFLFLSSGAITQGLQAPAGGSYGAERAYGVPYRPGLELAARLDMRRGELEFYVESVSMGVAFRFCPARHPAPLFPVVAFSTEGDVAELLYSSS